MSPEIASCKLLNVVEITHRVQSECRTDVFFNCMVFASCDTELQQVRFQCVTVHCRWILQEQGVRVPGCSGLMQQQVYNSSHDFLESPSCRSEVLTTETLLALQHPCPTHLCLPALHQVLRPRKGVLCQSLALPCFCSVFLEQIAICVKLCGFVTCR